VLSQLSYTPTAKSTLILKHFRARRNPFLRFSVITVPKLYAHHIAVRLGGSQCTRRRFPAAKKGTLYLLRNAAFKKITRVPKIKTEPRTAAMIQPTSRATANTPKANTAATMPNRIILKREIGPGREGPPGSLTIHESYKVILNRLLMEMFDCSGLNDRLFHWYPSAVNLRANQIFSARIYGDAALAISWTISKRRPDQPGPRPGPDFRAIQT
jgi:hypothetical protein